MNRTRRDAWLRFTLIELLVVIAIIAILAAMLLPSLNSARATAMEATCQSQEKQFGVGIQLYVDDNEGFYPAHWTALYGQTGGDSNYTWCEATYDYLGLGNYSTIANDYGGKASQSVLLFTCPADKQAAQVKNRCSYGINWQRDNAIGVWDGITAPYPTGETIRPFGPVPHMKEAWVPDPSGTFSIVDFSNLGNLNWGWRYSGNVAIRGFWYNSTETFTYPHKGANNYLLCDGHVQKLRPTETIGPSGVIGYSSWSRCFGIWTKLKGD